MSGGRALFPFPLGIFCSPMRAVRSFEQQTTKALREREKWLSEHLATTADQRPNGYCRLYLPQNKPEVARAADGCNCIDHYCWLSERELPLLGNLYWLSAIEEIGNSDKAFIHRDCSGFGTSVLATSQAIFWCPPDSGYREITPHSDGTSSKMLSAKK